MTPKEALDLEMLLNDADASTFRDYFKKLLTTLIEEEEGFCGKRPLGNSGWKNELYESLISNEVFDFNVIDGLSSDEMTTMDNFVKEMIAQL